MQHAVVGDKMGGPRTMVSVRVSTIGSDQGSLMPTVAHMESRLGARPEAMIADSGHATHEDIARVMARRIKPIVSPPRSPKGVMGTSVNRAPAIEPWHTQMTSEESKDLKRQRGPLSELVNAQQRGNQDVTQVLVRGATKVFNVMILGAIATS